MPPLLHETELENKKLNKWFSYSYFIIVISYNF